jgi:hypothetical protein
VMLAKGWKLRKGWHVHHSDKQATTTLLDEMHATTHLIEQLLERTHAHTDHTSHTAHTAHTVHTVQAHRRLIEAGTAHPAQQAHTAHSAQAGEQVGGDDSV